MVQTRNILPPVTNFLVPRGELIIHEMQVADRLIDCRETFLFRLPATISALPKGEVSAEKISMKSSENEGSQILWCVSGEVVSVFRAGRPFPKKASQSRVGSEDTIGS